MAERRSVPITFGGGLDRETGVMEMQPGGMEDLRNVHLMKGKFQVRRGFERVLTFEENGNAQTDVLAGIAVQGKQAAVYVTYDSVNYKVNVFVGDATGSWYSYLGEWPFLTPDSAAILSATNPDPPVVMLCEYNNVVMLAHTANAAGWRAQTYYVYWDEDLQVWTLAPLVVTWPYEGIDEDMEVRFRGVVSHIDYIVGWGFGGAYEDRPELVRVSKGGVGPASLNAKTGFDVDHYWIVGSEGDPVVTCVSVQETLLCFKETETWELFGRSYLTFGQRPLDAPFGVEQPRLAVNVEGAVFAWTNEGPRLFAADGTSEGLEIPLELTLPEPYDLPTKGSDVYAFAVYMPVYRSVWFVFGRRVYSLYIRETGRWKWGYQELGFDPLCGFRLPQAGWGVTTPPTGYPSVSGTVASETSVEVTVSNTDQDGDETLELWLKASGGSWFLKKSVQASLAASQDVTLENLQAGWYYDVAVRYRRGPYYTFGYEGSDPDAWPSSARGYFTTQFSTLPTIDSGVWSRTSASTEQILLTITPPFTGTGYDVEIRRNSVLVHTEEDVTGTFQYAHTGMTPEDDNAYDCRIVTAFDQGSYTSQVTYWGGPPGPTMTDARSDSALHYTLEWANALSAYTEVYDSVPSELEVDVMDNLRFTENPDQFEHISGSIPGSSGLEPWCGVRHKVQTYGVWDYSDIDAMQVDGPM